MCHEFTTLRCYSLWHCVFCKPTTLQRLGAKHMFAAGHESRFFHFITPSSGFNACWDRSMLGFSQHNYSRSSTHIEGCVTKSHPHMIATLTGYPIHRSNPANHSKDTLAMTDDWHPYPSTIPSTKPMCLKNAKTTHTLAGVPPVVVRMHAKTQVRGFVPFFYPCFWPCLIPDTMSSIRRIMLAACRPQRGQGTERVRGQKQQN